ncbi:MAG: DUF4105 domain-containing protein, partial [Flavobacteriaceae bacterium]
AFGHSAIRVKDHYQGLDIVFNYGTFDFEAPNFYLKFLKGELDYFLSTSSFIQFANYYQYYGRGVIEQKLNLNSTEKQKLYDALNEALLPENRFYRYEFLENNCATKIPEIINSATGLEITYADEINTKTTYRKLINEYLDPHSWNRFGISLILGSTVDRQITNTQTLFLPDYLYKKIGNAQLGEELLIENEKNLVVRYFKSKSNGFFTSPLFVAILFLIFSFYRIWPKASSPILGRLEHLLFGVLSITGIFLVFMMLGTEHLATKNNFNILWINPLTILGVVYNKRLIWLGLAISTLFTLVIQITGAQEIGTTAILLAISLGILYIRRAELTRR